MGNALFAILCISICVFKIERFCTHSSNAFAEANFKAWQVKPSQGQVEVPMERTKKTKKEQPEENRGVPRTRAGLTF